MSGNLIEQCRATLAGSELSADQRQAIGSLLSLAELGAAAEQALAEAFEQLIRNVQHYPWSDERKAAYENGATWLRVRAGELRGQFLPKELGRLE